MPWTVIFAAEVPLPESSELRRAPNPWTLPEPAPPSAVPALMMYCSKYSFNSWKRSYKFMQTKFSTRLDSCEGKVKLDVDLLQVFSAQLVLWADCAG